MSVSDRVLAHVGMAGKDAKAMPVVYVEWDDSATHEPGWCDLGDVRGTVEQMGALACRSAGFLIHETDDTLTIAHSWSPDYDGDAARACAPITIPKVAVTRGPITMAAV